jgi:hypothetical protein
MSNTMPIPYFQQDVVIPAGEKVPVPGQFTWLEFLSEFETASPSTSSNAVQIAFAPGGTYTPLPPGVTVIIPTGFIAAPLIMLLNTDLANSVTVRLAYGAGDRPARDQRLTLPVGTAVDVTVVNTGADPVPVSIHDPNPLPVVAPDPAAFPTALPANAVDIGDATAQTFNVAGTATVAPALGGTRRILKLASLNAGAAGSVIISSLGLVLFANDIPASTVVLPYPLIFPIGGDITITIGGAASCQGVWDTVP